MVVLSYCGFRPLQKWYVSFFLIPIGLYLIFHRGHYLFIDNADLIIHEAGHFFFGFLGTFIHFLGGTLMQIVFPLFIAFFFLSKGYRTGVQFFIFWLGQNLINISVYAADAPVRRLHLLGGGKHDWYYMLSRLGILDHAELVGYIFFSAAIAVFIIGVIFPLFMENYDYES
ncbi:MAG: hypothetical protein P8184_13170 [Calditrichia bacterium]